MGLVVFLCIITFPFEMDCLEQLASELVSSRGFFFFFFCIPACLFDRCGIIPLVLFFLCIPSEIYCEKELSFFLNFLCKSVNPYITSSVLKCRIDYNLQLFLELGFASK